MRRSGGYRNGTTRLALSATAATAVVAVAVLAPSNTGSVVAADPPAPPAGHAHLPGTPDHDHSDPATKNAISRASVTGKAAVDPTTSVQRVASEEYVERERALADPELTTVPVHAERADVPEDRYAMSRGCYTLQAPDGAFVVADGSGVRLAQEGTPFFFQATDLGSYLLHTDAGELGWAALTQRPQLGKPGPRADWTATAAGDGFVLTAKGRALAVDGDRVVTRADGTPFRLERTEGCTAYPEADVNVTGAPHAGVTAYQEVRGYVDAHTHGMAFEFLGGKVHCGRPWHRYGAPYALQDCDDHTLTGGKGALLEAFLSEDYDGHDPVGWPTFKDWPAPHSLTHEGTYWKWLERAWRGGQRLFVNLLVENNKLCELYPLKKNSCDDMDSVRLQAQRMTEFQDYIDAQYGGPGEGFYRIVRDPFEAREVINAGKMAVVMGIETSVPFGCTFKKTPAGDEPACDADDIDDQLDEMHELGVRQMELVNKFDNALAGVAGDAGQTGVMVNAANFLETGTFWDMEHCEPEDGESADKPQMTLPDISSGQQDALFGAVAHLFGGVLPAVPVYQQPAHCNQRGLTDLGRHTIEGMVERDMIFDPDHLSVAARNRSLDIIDELGHQGVISSHSWATPDAYPRVYEAGGFITPYAGDADGFVKKWRRHLGWADDRYYFGFGFGADINGLGAQGDPRGEDVPNPVTYPITGLNGVEIDRQTAGERTWDINTDGVAQYGLYPDWIEDLRQIADRQNGDGDAIVDDMTRGAEAYLQMWERSVGIAPDSCRNPDLRMELGELRRQVTPGMSTEDVLRRVGQPHQRLGTAYVVCATTPGGAEKRARITFDEAGNVVRVSS